MKGRHTHYTTSGFTIVELLIVVVVIAILAAVSLVGYGNIRARAADSTLKSTMQSISHALEIYKIENNGYPATQATPLSSGGSSGTTYLDANCVSPTTSSVSTANWIPGLDYTLPQSDGQIGSRGERGCFIYQSDGTHYILSAWNMVQSGPQTSSFYRRVGFREIANAQYYYCNHVNIGGEYPAPYDISRDYYKHSYTLSNITTCGESGP